MNGETDMFWEYDNFTEIKDGSILLTGEYKNNMKLKNGQELKTEGNFNSFIIKLNKNKEIEWAKSINSSGRADTTNIKETSDNKYLISGYFEGDIIIDGEEKVKKEEDKVGTFLMEFDSNGSVNWFKNDCYTGKYIWLDDQEILEDNSLLVTGSYGEEMTYNNNQKLTSGENEHKEFIIKYNSELQLEWIKDIKGYIEDFTQIKSGNMLIGISAGEDNLQIDGQSEPQQEAHTTKIYKCTLSGNLSETNIAIKDNVECSGIDLIAFNDGGYIVAENYGGYFVVDGVAHVDDGINTNTEKVITKYKSDDSVEWAKDLKIDSSWEYYCYITSIKQLGNNNYIMSIYCSGNNWNMNFDKNYILDSEKFIQNGTIILELDKNGNLICSKDIENIWIEGIIPQENNNFLGCGEIDFHDCDTLEEGKTYKESSTVVFEMEEYYDETDAPSPKPSPSISPSPSPEVTPNPSPSVSPKPEVSPNPSPNVEPTSIPKVEPSPGSSGNPSTGYNQGSSQTNGSNTQAQISNNNNVSNIDKAKQTSMEDYYNKSATDKVAEGTNVENNGDVSEEETPSSSPHTGDKILYYIAIFITSLMGIIVIVKKKNKNHKK